MEERNEDVPLPPRPKVVGIIYNLKKGAKHCAPDAEAELDSIETVKAIREALKKAGLAVELFEADETLPCRLLSTPIDIAFNIAEGKNGRGREAQIPALLNLLGIPFTGSDETTLCLALDKALTKRILQSYRIRTPKYALLSDGCGKSAAKLRYPVIVKPNAEGSSKGISDVSVVHSAAELKALAGRNLELYGGSMLAEEYIPGREFTVGVLGNGENARVFSPMEIVFKRNTQGDYRVYSFGVKQDFQNYVTYECPANIPAEVERELMDTAKKVYDILGCRDFARADFRLGSDGRVYFIEINPLPGLAPNYSDYPMLASACGVPYDALVQSVLFAGAQRCGIAL